MSDAQVRSLNTSIAASYDLLPFDPQVHDPLKPAQVFGAAAVYSCHSEQRNVLDLGCGTGRLLAAAAETMGGRVVGVDLSSSACEQAKRQCAPFGPRAEIIQADFLDLCASDLGEFDLIYLLGTIYVVPEPIRDHLLGLVAACLKPGGIAAIGYYSGLMPSAKAHIYRVARSLIAETSPPQEAVRRMREILADLQAQVTAPCASMTAALQQAQSLSDIELFHEALNPAFAPAVTSEIEARLAKSGVQLLNFVEANNCGRQPTSRQRAKEADWLDLTGGTYRRALFGRPMEGVKGCSLMASGAVWHCALIRLSAPDQYSAPGSYRDPGSGFEVAVHDPRAQAIVDEMKAQPRRLPDLVRAAGLRLERTGLKAADLDQAGLENILGEMWDYRMIIPQA